MQDVVWERLSGVDGNTEFVDASFHSFHRRSVMREALEAARLAQDAFRDVLPSQGKAEPSCQLALCHSCLLSPGVGCP